MSTTTSSSDSAGNVPRVRYALTTPGARLRAMTSDQAEQALIRLGLTSTAAGALITTVGTLAPRPVRIDTATTTGETLGTLSIDGGA